MFHIEFHCKGVVPSLDESPLQKGGEEGPQGTTSPPEPPATSTSSVPFYCLRTTPSLSGTLRLFRNPKVSISEAQGRSRTLFIPAVPQMLGTSDLCAFLGSLMGSVEHMRVLRTEDAPGRYSVLLRFSSQQAADRCFRGYNGRPFSNLLDPSMVCRALYVESSRVEWVGEGSEPPGLLEKDALRLTGGGEGGGGGEGARGDSPSLVELPSCPVCLERLDSSASGLLTTLCQHSFHSDCLSRWAGSDACPVCRYCLWQEAAEGGGAVGPPPPLSDDSPPPASPRAAPTSPTNPEGGSVGVIGAGGENSQGGEEAEVPAASTPLSPHTSPPPPPPPPPQGVL